jgi:aspartate aminotransferase-like enzyme
MQRLIMLPGPTNVSERVINAMTRPIINHRGDKFRELYRGIVEKSRHLFQTDGDIVVFSSSGTGGVEAAVLNSVYHGDKVIVPVMGEFSQRLGEMVEIAGGKLVSVSSELGNAPGLDEIKNAIDSNPDASSIMIVHNETSTGIALPYLKELCSYAKDRGLAVVVDAISSLGGYSIPVDSWGIDICVTGSQKCLAAPPGLALLSIGKEHVSRIKQKKPSTRYFDIARYLDYQKRWETPFTPNLPLFYALDEALNELLEEGLASRVERHERMSKMLYSGLARLGLRFVAREEVRSRTVAATFYPEGIEDRQFRSRLEQEFGVTIAGGFGKFSGKVFRIGCMGLINQEFVERTLSAVESLLSPSLYKEV